MHSQDSPSQKIESDDPRVARAGTWLTQAADGASGGAYLYSTGLAADVLTLVFSGTTIEIVYLAGPHLGTLALEVDGTVLRTVITTSDQTAYQQTTTLNYLTDEPHTLRVYAQEGGVVAVDAFVAWLLIDEEGGIQSAVPYDTQNQLVYQCIGGAYDSRLCTGYTATTRTPITTGTNNYAPRWSPDGNRVLYFAYAELSPNAVPARYEILDVSGSGGGGEFLPVNQSPNLGAGAWSPDGTRIVYSAEYDWDPTGGRSGPALYVADLTNCSWTAFPQTGCATTSLTEDMSETTLDGGPDWSPDGSLIVFTRSSTYGYLAPSQLYTIHPDGSGLAPVNYNGFIPTGIKLGGGQWSPDGTCLLVTGINLNAPYNSALYILSLSIGSGGATVTGIQQVTTPTSSQTDSGSTWSRDGSQIAFVRSNWVCSPGCVTSNSNIRIATYNGETSTWTIDPNVTIPGGSPSWRWQQDATHCNIIVEHGYSVTPIGQTTPIFGIPAYERPFEARTVRFEGGIPPTTTVYQEGTYLQVDGYYAYSALGIVPRHRVDEYYIVRVVDVKYSAEEDWGEPLPESEWRWISIAAVRDRNENQNQYTRVYSELPNDQSDFSCLELWRAPFDTTVYSDREDYIESIREFGVDIRGDTVNDIVLGWADDELQDIRSGLTRTSTAFALIGMLGDTISEGFRTIMICGNIDNNPDPQIACDDVPDYAIFLRLAATLPTGSPYANYYNTADTNAFVDNGVCRTFPGSDVPDVNLVDATPAIIACREAEPNEDPFDLTPQTVVHELGHLFDSRSQVSTGGSLRYRVRYHLNGYGNTDDLNPAGQGILMRDCGFEVDSDDNLTGNGRLVDLAPIRNTDTDPDNNISLSSIGHMMGVKLNDPWVRGRRGWGSYSPDYATLSTFQRNPGDIGLPTTDPDPTDDVSLAQLQENHRLSETAADMFLNWVYRRTSSNHIPAPTTSIPDNNPDHACDHDNVPGDGRNNDLTPGGPTWEGFLNIKGRNSDGSYIFDPQLPGNRRFWWMEREMSEIIDVWQ